MSYYISVKPFYKTKVDQVWEKIFQGGFDEFASKELNELDKKLKVLNDDPKIERDHDLQEEERRLLSKKEDLSRIKDSISYIKEAVGKGDKEDLKSSVSLTDDYINGYFVEIDFHDTLYPFHELFVALFRIILQIDIDKDFKGTLSLVPTEKWIELYKKMSIDAVKEATASTEEDPNDPESIKGMMYLVRLIRDILRECIKSKSELKVYDELHDSEKEKVFSPRVEKIAKRFIEN